MSDLVIRAATESDLGVVIDFIRLLAESEGRPEAVSITEEKLGSLFFGGQAIGNGYLAFMGVKPVASALVMQKYSSYRGSRILYIEDIIVSPDARGSGVGAKFMQYLAQRALEQGCENMEWMALKDNGGALRFYQRLGAQIDPHKVLGFDHATLQKVASENV